MLRSGEHFGERSLLTNEPTVASVVAAEDVEMVHLNKATFEALLGASLQEAISRESTRRESQRLSSSAAASSMVRPSDLRLLDTLGKGAFGSVRLAVHRTSGARYALKSLDKGHLIATEQVQNTVNEKVLLQQCDHPFIITCHVAFHTRSHVSLVLSLAPGGELFTRIRHCGKLVETEAALYVAMVASALGYLSARSIAYRDLKPENLLFDARGYLVLADFGLAKLVTDRTWTFCGTPDYLAPESTLAHSPRLPTRHASPLATLAHSPR